MTARSLTVPLVALKRLLNEDLLDTSELLWTVSRASPGWVARFAEEFADEFHRVEAVSKIGTVMMILDLKNSMVREAILAGHKSPMEYYQSDIAVVADYSHS